MKNTILHINASAQSTASRSRKMSQHIVDLIGKENNINNPIIVRDLNQGVPFVDEAWVNSTFTPTENRSSKHVDKLKVSTQLVNELEEANTIVIGTPIYNFNIPASFKAWIDMIARVGLTFKYTETGPIGLLENKKVIIAIASGGVEIGSDYDFASPYLKQIFGFIGINDVTFVDVNAFDLENDNNIIIQEQLKEILS